MDETAGLRFTDPEPRIHPTADLKSFARYAAVGERVILRDVVVSDFRISSGTRRPSTVIGKFCSIAANTRVNALEPLKADTHRPPTGRGIFRGVDKESRAAARQEVTIGHDVWIGHGAVILPGVTIGNGAVVGANAVVTRSVAPYEIVAGLPAKVLRVRFAPAIVERLERLSWWDWPVEHLFEAIPDMQTLPIEAFLDRWEGKSMIPKSV
jgi:phosphonate metabolism protein (transferase hexapeptide repeat family)